jgi:hypothetical protein
MATHQAAGFSAAVQAAKGTAASTGFVRGNMSQSTVEPRYDLVDNSGEHRGLHERPTLRQSRPIRSGYIGDISGEWRLYPLLFPIMLIGAGFKVTTDTVFTLTITDGGVGDTFTLTFDDTGSNPQTTAAQAYNVDPATLQTELEGLSNVGAGNVTVTGTAGSSYTITFPGMSAYGSGGAANIFTVDDSSMVSTGTSSADLSDPYYSHAFVIARGWERQWLTFMHSLDESVDRYEKLAIDAQVSQLVMEATRSGITCTMTGLALDEEDAAGTETVTQDPDSLFTQAKGSFTITSSDLTAATIGVPIEHQMTIDNPLSEEEQELHSFKRAGLSPQGMEINGELRRLVWSEAAFKEFIRGSATGTEPVITIPEAQLTWEWQTAVNMPNLSVPYSVTIDIAYATVHMQAVNVGSEQGTVRYNATYEMLDRQTAAPITITIANTWPSYAGS